MEDLPEKNPEEQKRLTILDAISIVMNPRLAFFEALKNLPLAPAEVPAPSTPRGSTITPAATAPPPPADVVPQYVTLRMVSGIVGTTKRTIQKHLNDDPESPKPDIEAAPKSGKANQWIWDKLRPWLTAKYGRQLPEKFP